jgi:hypothetical protein
VPRWRMTLVTDTAEGFFETLPHRRDARFRPYPPSPLSGPTTADEISQCSSGGVRIAPFIGQFRGRSIREFAGHR